MIGVTVMLIMMTVAAQSWTFRMRREMELELIHRGEQYVRALDAFRKANGGAWPVGDLKVLEQKSPMGPRFIRKLYTNPMDPNGRWQYLYLHPGGSGFINPCASVLPGAGLGGPTPGQIPVSGFNVGAGAQGRVFGAGTLSGRGPSSSRGGRGGGQSMDQLSAVDPNAFKSTGLAKMNLPIVGVVNCEQVESIRTYMGQTWLNNWAFTPLAQGQFGGVAHTGAGGPARLGRISGGLGHSGGEFYNPKSKSGAAQRGGGAAGSRGWQRFEEQASRQDSERRARESYWRSRDRRGNEGDEEPDESRGDDVYPDDDRDDYDDGDADEDYDDYDEEEGDEEEYGEEDPDESEDDGDEDGSQRRGA
jgi:type II secretory pathway pseudopilin PulG